MFSKQDEELAREYLQLYCKKPAGDIHGIVEKTEFKRDLDIIVPCYNQETYLKKCLDSVTHYTFQRSVSVIIVDDGSTDGSAKIADYYGELPHVTVVHQDNKGIACTRNEGIRQSDSRYLFFLDADDYLFPEVLEEMLEFAIAHDADAVESTYRTLGVGEDTVDTETEDAFDAIHPATWEKLSGYVWGKVFKAEIFRSICFPEGYLMEDGIMGFLFAPLCKKVYFCEIPSYVYRMNPEGITANIQSQKTAIHTYWVLELCLDDLDNLHIRMDNGLYEKILAWITMMYAVINYQDENAKVAVFTLLCRRLAEWNREFSTENRAWHLLQQALLAEDYPMYCRCCEIAFKAGMAGVK